MHRKLPKKAPKINFPKTEKKIIWNHFLVKININTNISAIKSPIYQR